MSVIRQSYCLFFLCFFLLGFVSSEAVLNRAMVSSQDEYASEVGVEILKNGGNAVDAAVAVAYTLAVTHPRAGNIGGGGFMLVYIKEDDKVYAIDFREKAPYLAYKDMFLDDQGNVDNEKARRSIFSVGVPGTVAGLELAYDTFGSYSRSLLLQPAIELAQKGFIVDSDQKKILEEKKAWLIQDKWFRRLFYDKKSGDYKPKDRVVQKHLAQTLKRIQSHGKAGFYSGKTAAYLESYFKRNHGLIRRNDLNEYQALFRDPIQGTYHGYDIVSMPPPSSGGVAVVQALNILEHLDSRSLPHNSVDYVHLVSDTLKYVYADRAYYLGDQDFVDVPVEMLIDKDYAASIADNISVDKVVDVTTLKPDMQISPESNDTTHFSVVDFDGNVVSCTYTLNFSYGNGMIAGKTGIILNDEMDDFVSKPGSPNGFGLLGNDQNAIEPEKRMLSSMTPTIVLKEGTPYLITGSPGGSTIITTVLQMILNVIDYDMTIQDASERPRFHHQWYPDVIVMEAEHDPNIILQLENRGFKTKEKSLGISQSILIKGDDVTGQSDPRNETSSTQFVSLDSLK